jgi:hypothetical protein
MSVDGIWNYEDGMMGDDDTRAVHGEQKSGICGCGGDIMIPSPVAVAGRRQYLKIDTRYMATVNIAFDFLAPPFHISTTLSRR